MHEVLRAADLFKSFGDVSVLRGVSLTINKGDFVSVVGASGSGKSTLLTILGGIDKPTSGSVFLSGQKISSLSERDLAVLRRTKIGFVFQFFNLAPALTAEENILLPLVLGGKKTKAFAQKLDELMTYLGIAEQRNKLPSRLSGGEQQRVAIARGLIFSPQVLLLDEPTGNLDSQSSLAIMELLSGINKKLDTTIVQVTHSKTGAAFGNRVISIKDGNIIDTEKEQKSVFTGN